MSKVSKEDQGKRNQMQNDYQKVFMRTAAGRRVLKDLLAITGVFELSYTGDGRGDFNDGGRAIGLKIMEALDKKTYAGLRDLEEAGVTDTEIYSER